MINVQCDACRSPYQVDERRVPASGLKMRCSKCGNSILVQKSTTDLADQSDLPIPAPPRSRGVAPVFPRGPVMPKAGIPAPKAAAPTNPEKAALAFARGEASRFDFPVPNLEDDPLADIDLPSPATLVSKEKLAAPVTDSPADDDFRASDRPTAPRDLSDAGASDRITSTDKHRPSERPTAPHLPAVAVPKTDVTKAAAHHADAPPRGKPTVRQMVAVIPEEMTNDLPALVPSREAIAPPMPQPNRSVADLPSIATNQPARQTSVAELPSPARTAQKRTPDIDLPDTDLAAAEAEFAFSEFDLPATVPAHAGAKVLA